MDIFAAVGYRVDAVDLRRTRLRSSKTTNNVHEQGGEAKNLAQGRSTSMNCPSCLGRLWLQDVNGDFFKCALCQATGEPKNELASVIDIATARNLRNSRRAKKVVQDNPDGDAA